MYDHSTANYGGYQPHITNYGWHPPGFTLRYTSPVKIRGFESFWSQTAKASLHLTVLYGCYPLGPESLEWKTPGIGSF
ncbi:hypothetical protein BABINDRAFT_159412 [Babjeviella inositovora NRRL Y-12698]|uniref:Uncharacterized protein n=1 Tax=Babjeviella inositovora NRRL Y-12698 TaxID=984486 RepID=A0A1E3R0M1_9ASCO|nr:uncharacterized protein BABINDRAFT_159412 [Babjeviella inositovora NRRL Y-12698]ODQ82927.1 hypothetical protein BABINDRAFT_159412 [Babjeviella inositovora NRRL Y-12698]